VGYDIQNLIVLGRVFKSGFIQKNSPGFFGYMPGCPNPGRKQKRQNYGVQNN